MTPMSENEMLEFYATRNGFYYENLYQKKVVADSYGFAIFRLRVRFAELLYAIKDEFKCLLGKARRWL